MFVDGVSSFLTTLFSGVWDMFQITWPGTNFSIFSIFASVAIGLFLFKIVTGFISGDMFSKATERNKETYRSGKTKNSKISQDRKGDEK